GAAGRAPTRIVHLWGFGGGQGAAGSLDESLELGFYALLALGRAVAAAGGAPVRLTVVADGLQAIAADEAIVPEKAPILGLCSVLPQEMPGLACQAVDVPGDLLAASGTAAGTALDTLLALLASPSSPLVAVRAGRVAERIYIPAPAPAPAPGGGAR